MNSSQQASIEHFRTAIVARLVERFSQVAREDRPDGSILADRFRLAERLWLEVAVRPHIPQVRVGIGTDSRWLSEELEQAIEDSGDTMSEFVELGFDEAGLDWHDPVVEHFREQGKYFYFATSLNLPSLAALEDEATRDRTRRMAEGYFLAFRGAIQKAAAK